MVAPEVFPKMIVRDAAMFFVFFFLPCFPLVMVIVLSQSRHCSTQ